MSQFRVCRILCLLASEHNLLNLGNPVGYIEYDTYTLNRLQKYAPSEVELTGTSRYEKVYLLQ